MSNTAVKATAYKHPDPNCARCRRAHVSVGKNAVYRDLCCICAYDIHHLLVVNAHLFKKEGEFPKPPKDE